MKKILTLTMLLFGALLLNAQSPWFFGVESNFADFRALNEDDAKLIDIENWNGVIGPSRLVFGKHITPALAVAASFSMLDIDKYVAGNQIYENLFWDADLGLQLHPIQELWFDPYIAAGIGYNKVNKENNFLVNGGLGFNFWVIPNFGLTLRGDYDYMPSNKDFNYLHVGAGLKLKLGKAPDADGDGISDRKDACPNVPGLAIFDGCPDTDGDGIQDSEDQCPNKAGIAAFNGCPDTDGDGIEDRKDQCPNKPGPEKFNGCPDSDGDGISDKNDNCPDKPGLSQFNGCPDSDGDGIPDSKDKCPTLAGSKAANGCPDSDGDGIVDKEDKCPTVPGLAKFNGCPDRDGDGIEDKVDKCPDQAGTVANNGCPEIKEEVKEKIINIARAIYFETGSDRLKASSKAKLDELATILNEYGKLKMTVEGHTDNVGKDEFNLELSQKRASSVVNYLISKGIDPGRLTPIGYGETRPIADNSTSSGKQQNRRVELKSAY